MDDAQKTMLAKQLELVQRVALISINDAPRTTPIMELNAILHVAPVDIAGRLLLDSNELGRRGSKKSHFEIFLYVDCIPDNLDHHIVEPSFSCFFFAHILGRNMWTIGRCWRRGIVKFFTNGWSIPLGALHQL